MNQENELSSGIYNVIIAEQLGIDVTEFKQQMVD